MVTSSLPSDFSSGSSSVSGEETVKAGFRDENICGEGATCRVYVMRLGGLRVAVKRLKEEYLTEPTHVAAYRKEFLIGQSLKHDALPVYRELRADMDEVYIVMDFIDGVTLDDFLETEEGKIYFRSTENAKCFFTGLLNAVRYLHRSGVIHCDLKPANIMLRHSDRGVMLLDLDKAYSDTLDRSHGGTPSISDPLEAGETPKVLKDFAAIGKLVDEISARVPGFSVHRFKRFRKECANPASSEDSLVKALEYRSHSRIWIGEIIGFCLFVGLIYYFIGAYHSEEKDRPANPEISNMTVTPFRQHETPFRQTEGDNKQVQASSELPASGAGVKVTEKIALKEFDKEMGGFISEVEDAGEVLASGDASDAELRDLMGRIIDSYTARYSGVVTRAKENNPEVSGIEVEIAVAKASEKSRASRLYENFIRSVADTLTARHP